MRIDEILSRKRTLSFEVFPPQKGSEDKEKLFGAIESLKELSPDFISVTYGAGGSNSKDTVEISHTIKKMGIEPLSHITGGPSAPEEIKRLSEELEDCGVENVLALRGDKPIDMPEDFEYAKYYHHASDLMEELKGKFCLGGACYPEGHFECKTLGEDLLNLKKKQDAGAKFLITQVFYDNSYYYRLLHEAKEAGVTVPIIPGLMPILSVKSIHTVKALCGSVIPLDLRNMIEKYATMPNVMHEMGINYAVYQITDLIAKGAPGIHLEIMNKAETAFEICGRLKNVFGELFR